MGDGENIVTTFYVEGEVSLCWDRETGEFVSLHMNSTLVPDDFPDMHAPLSSSVASSPFLNSDFDSSKSHSDVLESSHPTSSSTLGRPHTCVLDRAGPSCSNVDVCPLAAASSNIIDRPSTESVQSAVPIVTAMPLNMTIPSPPTHEQVCAKGSCNPNVVKQGSFAELPSVPIQSKTSTHKTKSEKTESVNSLAPSTYKTKLEKAESVDALSGSASTSSPAKQKQTQKKANCASSSACSSLGKKAKNATLIPSSNKEPSGAPVNCPSVDKANYVPHTPMTTSPSVVEDNVVSSHPTTNQKGLENTRKTDPVLVCKPSSRNPQSTELDSLTIKRETRPNLSPWFSTTNTLCEASQASCTSTSTSSEKSSADSMPTSRSSVERTGHASFKEPSTKSSEQKHPSLTCSTDSHSSHCLRSSCKDGNCRVNLIPSASMSSSPESGKTAMNVSFAPSHGDEVAKPYMTANKKCESSLTTKTPKQANDLGSKTDGHSGSALIDSHCVPYHEKTPISPPDENKACTTPLSLIDEPFPPSSKTQPLGVEATLQLQMDNTLNRASQMDATKPEAQVSFSGKMRKKHKKHKGNGSSTCSNKKDFLLTGLSSKPFQSRTNSDFEAIPPSSNENGKSIFLVSPVDEKPTLNLSSLPPSSSKTQTSLSLDSFEEKPAILNSFIDPARLVDFANTFLSFPAAAEQKTDPFNPADITEHRNTKSGKRSRDARSSSTSLPGKKFNQTMSIRSLGDTTGIPTIPTSKKTSPVSPMPSTAKISKRPKIGDFSSSKGSIRLHAPLNNSKKRPRESDSSLDKLNDDIAPPSEQPELPSSSHQPHSTRKGGKNSLNWSDSYGGRQNKRRKPSQVSFRPTDCCRPRNAFIFFSMTERQRIAAAHPHSDFGKMSKLVAWSWHNMSDAEKKPYRMLALEDANRYYNEVSKSHQTWERLADRGLQILYVVDLVCEWLSQKLPRWANYLSRSSIG